MQVSVLNSEGEVIDQFTVKNEPLQIVVPRPSVTPLSFMF